MTVDSSVAECGESGSVLQHQSQQVAEADGSTPSLLSPAETAIVLKLCPICASIAEKRGGYDWGKVGCSSWECPIRNIAFYPERWNGLVFWWILEITRDQL